MVRLKVPAEVGTPIEIAEFQFLNGTIKSIGGQITRNGITKFQFLNGTIKRFMPIQ